MSQHHTKTYTLTHISIVSLTNYLYVTNSDLCKTSNSGKDTENPIVPTRPKPEYSLWWLQLYTPKELRKTITRDNTKLT